LWQKNTDVRLIRNPGRVGFCTGNIRERANKKYVQIKFNDGSTDYVFENELEILEALGDDDHYALIRQGAYGRAADLRRNLTYVHLAGRLANLVYSLGITNTDFWPHQYKPLLALLESPANGILIADEVGLGKTIEAGLIWTELRARFDMRRLLVICPAMLREKWRDELMIRFGINARIMSAKDLLDDLKRPKSSTGDGEAWIASYQSLRPPKDFRSTKDNIKKPSARRLFCDFLEENSESDELLDMVIFDEAHYMRNEDSAVNTLGNLVRDISDYLVLLSATPINLKNNDLFNLLRLTDPDHFRDPYDFADMIDANKPLIKARDLVLSKNLTLEELMLSLNDAKCKNLLKDSYQLNSILEDPPSQENLKDKAYRAELADSLERMNLLGSVLTRTRKRDIHTNRPKRNVHKEAVPMTHMEECFYTAVTDLTRKYALQKDIVEGFLLATFQRQVCSCPAATLRNWKESNKNPEWLKNINNDANEQEGDFEEKSMSLKDYIYFNLPSEISVDGLIENDSKYERFEKVIRDFLGDFPEEKIIVFSAFRATAHYLTERLQKSNINSLLIWGDMNRPKQEFIDEFKNNKNLKVMISTEVSAEGVDLQFCKFLINFDLPWNPMRIEQRIGRIDRLGQKSDNLHIWNLYFQNSIDDKIVSRLLNRIKIFEEALGEPEPVVGETISKLEAELLTRELTPEQENEKIEQAALALENLKQVQDRLQENASQIISHGGLLLERIEAAENLSKRVTEKDLIVYVRDFLVKYAQGHIYEAVVNAENTFNIKLPARTAAELDDFLRKKQLIGQSSLSSGGLRKCLFLNKVNCQGNKSFETINQFHPLIRFISEKIKESNEAFHPIVSIKVKNTFSDIEPGDYVFCIKKLIFEGVKSEEILNPLAGNIDTKKILSEDDSDKLVNLARLEGTDWLDASSYIEANDVEAMLDELEDGLDQRYNHLLKRKLNENKDRVSFQLNSLNTHLDRKVASYTDLINRLNMQGKQKGAQLNEGKLKKLREKISMQIEKIKLREGFDSTKNFVCAGVIRVI
jgi:SNF2 family DNA or RNA helicase